MKDRRRARVIIAPRTGTGRPCRPAKAGRHWSPGTAGSGRRPAPRRRKSSGRRRRRPTAARTVLHAAASGAARSRSAPPVQRRQPLPLRPEPRLRQVQPLLLHPRWRRRRLSRNRARVSPCSFPGIAGPARRQSARPRRLLDNQSGMRCEWRKSVRWSAVRRLEPLQPLARQISPALLLRPREPRLSALRSRPAWRVPPQALPRHAPRSGNSTRGSSCSSAGIAAKPRRPAGCWSNATCNRSGTEI